MKHEELTSEVIGLCIKIHKELGPGLLESVYEEAICFELDQNQIPYKRQCGISVKYQEVNMGLGFRADIIIDEKLVLEIKSIENMSPVFPKVLLTYLRFTQIEVGLLINFNVILLKDGITRIVLNKKTVNL